MLFDKDDENEEKSKETEKKNNINVHIPYQLISGRHKKNNSQEQRQTRRGQRKGRKIKVKR